MSCKTCGGTKYVHDRDQHEHPCPICNRTYEQMYEGALTQRRKMIDEGLDPKDGVFVCTQAEKLTILDRPPFMNYELSAARDRICGLKIALTDASPDSGSAHLSKL